METKKLTFADRVSAAFALIKEECKKFFSKENLKDIGEDIASSFKVAFKSAFNKKFLKTCLIILGVALAIVLFWICFAHSTRLGWWVLSLSLITLIAYWLSGSDLLVYARLLFALLVDIAALALFCICFYVGKFAYYILPSAEVNELPEQTAAFGFAVLAVLCIFFGLLFAIYAGFFDREKQPLHFWGFIIWLLKWAVVLALVVGLCYLILKFVLPLV